MTFFLRGTIRVVGWLMTPFVVWGASVIGAWIGSWIARLMPSATAAMALSVTLAIGWGVTALVWWVRSLGKAARHSKDRRRAKAAKKSAQGSNAVGSQADPSTDNSSESDSLRLVHDEAVA